MATPVSPVATDRLQREMVLRLVVNVPASAMMFALTAPMAGVLVAWLTPPTVMELTSAFASGEAVGAALLYLLFSAASAYAVAMVPAAIAGALIAVSAAFAVTRARFYLDAAATGTLVTYGYVILMVPRTTLETALLYSVAGGVAALLCTMATHTWLMTGNKVLENRAQHRDRLARERAERLKAARAAAG